MPSIKSLVAVATLILYSGTTAAPLDHSTNTLTKRATWVFGQSTCPADDGDQYNGPKGGAWRIRCGKDTAEGGYLTDISPKGNVLFKTCIQTCGNYPDRCVRVTFNGDVDSPGACYLKGSASSSLVSKTGYKVATKLNP